MTDPTEALERLDCAHRSLMVLLPIQADGTPGMWACRDCQLRFYPACRTCVDVGHRNVVHSARSGAEGLDELAWATAIHEVQHYGPPTLTCMTRHRKMARKLAARLHPSEPKP